MSFPQRRAAFAAFVALLLVTAGCSGGPAPTSTATTPSITTTTAATPTTTPAAPTTTATGNWSPHVSEEQYPPGVADNGTLANVTALLDAHVAATANRTTRFTVEWTTGEDSFYRSYTRGASPTPYYSVFNRTTDGERTTERVYGTGSQDYARVTVDDETVYPVLQNTTADAAGLSAWTEAGAFGPRTELAGVLSSGNYSVDGTVERGGRTLVQLTAEQPAPARCAACASYRGTVLVTPEGVVHDVEASYTTESDGERTHTEVSITVDTDAELPGPLPWMADVPQLSIAIVEDGHAVEIRNTGGAALPANATFDVFGATEPVRKPSVSQMPGDATGTVTTDSRLEPGDAVYVTAGADGDASSFALHDEPARGEYTFGFAGLTGTPENVYYRLATGLDPGQADQRAEN
ncbi:MAG: hypothetical protein ABEJ88_03620 [Halobacterium sp.]